MRTMTMIVMGLFAAGCFGPEDSQDTGARRNAVQLDHPGPTCSVNCITEFPAPSPGMLFGIVTGPDNAIWFHEPRVSKLGRLTLDGDASEFPLLTPTTDPAAQGFLGVGPDRRSIWFTERFRADATPGKIGRISVPRDDVAPDEVAYEMTEFALPRDGCFALGFAAGPDGAMWFTESCVSGVPGAVGRITDDGELTEYVLPETRTALGIVAGPDGALWFTENRGHQIGRITTDGQLTEYPLPWSGTVLRLTVGTDDAIWFTDFGANRIGRITLDGDLESFPVPAGTGPVGITRGPDKAIWFTGFNSNEILRMNLAGEVTHRFSIPTPSSVPFAITVGPDRNLWFTEAAANKIGRLRLHDEDE